VQELLESMEELLVTIRELLGPIGGQTHLTVMENNGISEKPVRGMDAI